MEVDRQGRTLLPNCRSRQRRPKLKVNEADGTVLDLADIKGQGGVKFRSVRTAGLQVITVRRRSLHGSGSAQPQRVAQPRPTVTIL